MAPATLHTSDSPRLRIAALAIAALHLVVLAAHGWAHGELGVELSTWQQSFVGVVIVALPLLALLQLWRGRTTAGLLLWTAAFAAALLFGLYHHYVLISPDHVAHLPPGEAQGLFRTTALAMAIVEGLGFALGLSALRPTADPD